MFHAMLVITPFKSGTRYVFLSDRRLPPHNPRSTIGWTQWRKSIPLPSLKLRSPLFPLKIVPQIPNSCMTIAHNLFFIASGQGKKKTCPRFQTLFFMGPMYILYIHLIFLYLHTPWIINIATSKLKTWRNTFQNNYSGIIFKQISAQNAQNTRLMKEILHKLWDL